LYRPFARSPLVIHEGLVQRKSKLIEWSILRLVNLAQLRGVNLAELAVSLEDTPTTRESAVLTAKLGDIYTAQGKPASAITAYQRALQLDPSPPQRLSLRLTLGEKLLAENRIEDARKNYKQLLAEAPDYPDQASIQQRLITLVPKPAK